MSLCGANAKGTREFANNRAFQASFPPPGGKYEVFAEQKSFACLRGPRKVVRAMKIRLLFIPLFATLFVAGCGKKESSATGATAGGATAPSPASPPAGPAAPAPAAGARVIEITANDTMKFSVTAIEAKVGEELKIILTNIGTLPKEAMGHNLVVLKAGSDVTAFAAAAMMARDKDYIPEALKDQIIAHTALLGPRKSDEVTFKLTAAGVYPFVCSFPAHGMAGMKGTITVK